MENLWGFWYDRGNSTKIAMINELEGNRMDELNKEKLQQASGGVYEDAPHCPKCQGTDLVLIGPVDIGTPPCYR